MGIKQHFRSTASWDQATGLLDHSFPLAEGSHATVTHYLCYFDHLLAVQADGTSTGLARPSQFVECIGERESPSCIRLEQDSLQVEIEPAHCKPDTPRIAPEHRMQLLTSFSNV